MKFFSSPRALREAGIIRTLDTVSDGDRAIERLSFTKSGQMGSTLPDALVLDLRMPRKDGFEVLAWMKEQDIRSPVIVHTSSDDPSDAAKALTLGASAVVIKQPHYRPLVEKLSVLAAGLHG